MGNWLHIGEQEPHIPMEAKLKDEVVANRESKSVSRHTQGPLILSPLCQLGWCSVASTTRALIEPESDPATAVQRCLAALEVNPREVGYCVQRHTAKVEILDGQHSCSLHGFRVIPECDGLVACHASQGVAVFTADCVPIVLVEQRKRIVAAVHAGWRGSFQEIAKNAVHKIIQAGGSASDIRVWIGPAIGGCCYEVSVALAEEFRSKFGHRDCGARFLRGRLLDLVRLNILQLTECGVSHERIEWCGLCTRCHNETFYSYRVEGAHTGRMVTLVVRTI